MRRPLGRAALAAAAVLLTAAGAAGCGSSSAGSGGDPHAKAAPSPTSRPGKPGTPDKPGKSGKAVEDPGDSVGRGSAAPSAAPGDASPGAKGSPEPAGPPSGGGDGTRPCRNTDLALAVSKTTGIGPYLLVKAVARAGVSCTLSADAPRVSLGPTAAALGEKPPGEAIRLGGSRAAYAGIAPATAAGGSARASTVTVAVGGAPDGGRTLRIPGAAMTVNTPLFSRWHTSADASSLGSSMGK